MFNRSTKEKLKKAREGNFKINKYETKVSNFYSTIITIYRDIFILLDSRIIKATIRCSRNCRSSFILHIHFRKLYFNQLHNQTIKQKNKMKKTMIIAGLALTVFASCTRIDAGHEGILIKQYGSDKGVQDVSLVTGRVWYNPWTEDVEQYATFIQTIDYDAFNVNAKDGSEFIVDPTLSFNIVAGNSPKIFSKYRKDLEEVSKTTNSKLIEECNELQTEVNKLKDEMNMMGGYAATHEGIVIKWKKLAVKRGVLIKKIDSALQSDINDPFSKLQGIKDLIKEI